MSEVKHFNERYVNKIGDVYFITQCNRFTWYTYVNLDLEFWFMNRRNIT